jgi:hypothetical protein
MLFLELAQDGRDERVKICATCRADIDLSGFAACATRHACLRALHVSEDDARFLEHELARIREFHAARFAAKQRRPISRSSCLICELNDGCVMPRFSAARVKFSSSATATKYRR